MNRIVVLNGGSTTLKGAIFEVDCGVARNMIRRSSPLARGVDGEQAFASLLEGLLGGTGLRSSMDRIDGIAHRVVHGGAVFAEAVRVDTGIESQIEKLAVFAPLHNRVALAGIRAARRVIPARPQFAVFDTAFHARRDPASLVYALPTKIAEELDLRRFGFHGIAHAALTEALARARGVPTSEVSAVTLQLGGGASGCAVSRGRSIETSMGLSPLGGLPMGTRSGDLDPGVVLALMRWQKDPDEVERLLAEEAGLRGLCGRSDMRDVLAAEAEGDERAGLALSLFVRGVVSLVGAYLTLLAGDGAIVFGGGIGAGSSAVRERIAEGLVAWNVALDLTRNRSLAQGCISQEGTRPVYFFETDEEDLIAREADSLLRETRGEREREGGGAW